MIGTEKMSIYRNIKVPKFHCNIVVANRCQEKSVVSVYNL